MFVRKESFREFVRFFPVTITFALLHLFIYFIISLKIGISDLLLNETVGYNLFIKEGQWWRLITPLFVHADFTHMFFNTISLLLFAPPLERLTGSMKFVILYIGSGLIGNLATLCFEPIQYVHTGASGALFGLFGVYAYLIYFRKEVMTKENAMIVLLFATISLIVTLLDRNINMIAHLFGLLGGGLLAPFFTKRGSF